MTIRPYSSSDKDKIIELLRLNTPKYFSETEEKDLIDYLDNHIDHYYVLEEKDILLGCGGFNITKDGATAYLSWAIIHPEQQGKGLGSIITKHRIAEINKIEGVKDIAVRTSQHVYKFYEKMGFSILEIVKDYWAKGFDLYDMKM